MNSLTGIYERHRWSNQVQERPSLERGIYQTSRGVELENQWKCTEEGEISPLIGNYNIWSDKYLNPIE